MTGLQSARRHALPIGIALLLIAPLVVGCIALGAEPFAPIYDMALIEQRVRDVGTAHTPLVGLPGRLGTPQQPASHPGPLAFWLLAPGYHVFGGSAWALYASGALVNAAAIAAFIYVVWRRRKVLELALASAGLGLLMLGYGPGVLAEPWNPYFPVLWFAVFLASGWAVACGDLMMLPVAAATASIAAQTHIPYLAVCGGLGAICAAAALRSTLRAPEQSPERRRGVRSLMITLAILIVAWLPLLIEELRGEPGNITRLVRYFREPSSVPLGIGPGLLAVLSRLDARSLTIDPWLAPGGFSHHLYPTQPGLLSGITLAFWVLGALVAIRTRVRLLWTLHAMVALAFGVAVLAASRIVGDAMGHVLLWCWALAVLVLVASAASFVTVLATKLAKPTLARLAPIGTWLAVAAVGICAVRLAWEARQVRPSQHAHGKMVRTLALDTIRALHEGRGLATGLSGRYIVSWSDPIHGGALGMSLANELERAGFNVAYEPAFVLGGAQRTHDRTWASARIHFASGGWIAEGRHAPGAVLISRIDPRTPAEERESRRLLTHIRDVLRRAGREDLARRIPYDLPGVQAVNPKDFFLALTIARVTDIGWPAAVFVMPPQRVLVRTLTR